MLTVFEFEQNEIRFIGTPDNPWWVATDICTALEVKNVSQAIERLDDDERSMLNIGRQGEAWCINESGLYALILTSRKPQAKRFKKWITSEILPSIRKTGQYAIAASGSSPQPQFKPTEQEIAMFANLVLDKADLPPNIKAAVIGNAIIRQHPQHALTFEVIKPSLSISIEAELVRPTVLAERLSERTGESWSAIRVNKLLIDQCFQIKNPDGKNPAYLPTEKSKGYSQLILETAKGRDKTIQSLQWKLCVLEAIELGGVQ